MRNISFPNMLDGQTVGSIQEQNAAAHQEQRNRASCKTAPKQALQPRSAPDPPAKQNLAGHVNHYHAGNRKRFRIINGRYSPAGHGI